MAIENPSEDLGVVESGQGTTLLALDPRKVRLVL